MDGAATISWDMTVAPTTPRQRITARIATALTAPDRALGSRVEIPQHILALIPLANTNMEHAVVYLQVRHDLRLACLMRHTSATR